MHPSKSYFLRYPSLALACVALLASRPVSAMPENGSENHGGPILEADGMVEIVIDDPYTRAGHSGWVRDRVKAELEAEGITAPGEAENPWRIRLEIRGHTLKYAVAVSAFRGETVVVPPPSEFTPCLCGSGQLLDLVAEKIRSVVAELQTASARAEEAAAHQPPPPQASTPPEYLEVSPPSAPPPEPQRRAKAVGGMGVAGIVAMGAGALSLGFGITMVSIGSHTEAGELYDIRRDFRNPGTYTAIGLGAAALAAGIVLIAVDRRVCRKHPQKCRTRPTGYATANAIVPFTFRF